MSIPCGLPQPQPGQGKNSLSPIGLCFRLITGLDKTIAC